MRQWKYKVKIKHLLIDEVHMKDPDDLSATMKKIGETLSMHKCFNDFEYIGDFQDHFEDLEDANYLLDDMYDYADREGIWIE